MTILTADLHLTDNPDDEYRWAIFPHLIQAAKTHGRSLVGILGDLTDRKDRHSGELVNRLMANLRLMTAEGLTVVILMGNHDRPLNGTPFWQFLEGEQNQYIRFFTKPTVFGGFLWLPYSPNPRAAWEGLKMTGHDAVFMHQPVSGAVGNNGFTIQTERMPLLPRGVKFYSGDIHGPQTVGRVEYIGAPYPVAFGDTYKTRILALNLDNAKEYEEIPIRTLAKHMVRVESLDALEAWETDPGDQARVIYRLDVNELPEWPMIQSQIELWSATRELKLASIEPELMANPQDGRPEIDLTEIKTDPASVVAEFARMEDLSEEMLEAGLAIIKQAQR